jgi:N-acylglucosamine 2-epimerase
MTELNHLLAVYRDGLLHDTLPFWLKHAVDHEHGGYMTSLARDGSLLDSDKGVWQQGRFAWLLLTLYNTVERRPEWLQVAELGIRFLDQYCMDPEDGRFWFQVTREGQPLRKRRYAFSESFAAIAYGQFAKATGNHQYAVKAEAAFRRFLQHHLQPDPRLAKFTNVRPTRGLAFPMISIVTAQDLRGSIGLNDADAIIDHSIDAIRRHHVKREWEVVLEVASADGKPLEHFDARTLNPGHAIEGAWFILWEGKRRQDRELIELGCDMLSWMWRRGWDTHHGGLLYFVDLHGLPVQEYWHDMKFWWPHNEAVIATLLAYQLTGDLRYKSWHRQVHDWSHRFFPDRRHGEWFGYLHRDGSLSSTVKGNLWKGAFHLPRMQLTCWKLLEEMS